MMNINSEISKEDIIFDYIIKGSNSIYEPCINKMGGKVYYYNYSNPINRISNIYKIIKLNRQDYDVFYYNTSGTYFIFPVLFAYIFKYKIVTHAHNDKEKDLSIIYIILNIVNRVLINRISKLKLKCSDFAGKWVFNKSNNIIQINNAINIEKFKFNNIKRNIIRKELNLSDNEVALVNIGRLSKQKNQIFLLQVFNDLLKIKDNYILYIIGDGEEREELNKYIINNNIRDKVRLLGAKDNIDELIQGMDIFLLPSFYEGFPITSVEAQCSGIKCLVSDKVTKQIEITDLVEFLSIDCGTEIWTHKILTTDISDRKSYVDVLKNKLFDKRDISNKLNQLLNTLVLGD